MANKNVGPKEPSKIAADAPVSATELNTERDRLSLEKLQLDNDEQKARIAQLKIRWWQKPATQYGVIVPLIGFIVFLANNATRDIINQAKFQKQQAEIEKQKNEMENQRLEFLQQQLAPRVAQLERDEQRLATDVFNRYAEVCEIGGRIAAAESAAIAEQITHDLDKALLMLADPDLKRAITTLKHEVSEWKQGLRPVELHRFSMLACARIISSSCNKKFQNDYANKYPKAIRNMAIGIYNDALSAAKDLRAKPDRADATADIERFFEIYYGKLTLIDLVQSERVRTAMTNAENALYEWQKGSPNHDVLDRLINVLTKELDELARKRDDELTVRDTAVETKPILVSPPMSH